MDVLPRQAAHAPSTLANCGHCMPSWGDGHCDDDDDATVMVMMMMKMMMMMQW